MVRCTSPADSCWQENFPVPRGHVIASNLSPVIINYGPTYQVNFTDMLTKPATWDIAGFGMNGYVGTWSQVKHKLIIDATGIRNFNALTNAQKYQVQSVAARYLADYNDANPGNPLKKRKRGSHQDLSWLKLSLINSKN